MCRTCKYSVRIDVRFVRLSTRFDVQTSVATFSYYAKVTSDVTEIDLKSIIETINSELEHFYLYNPWWNMDRIVKACVYTASYDSL